MKQELLFLNVIIAIIDLIGLKKNENN
ncbi:hypothetical protein LCGC14_2618380, partial [marine sediment metagenome]